MTQGKPHQVILWGSFAPLHDYLALLKEAGIRVACLVDPLNQRSGGGAIPVRSVAGFVQDADYYRGMPIVVLEDRQPSQQADPVWEAVKTLTCEFHVENPLLDPVFVADHLTLQFPGRVLAAGFPGSGNGVVQAVIERLLPEKAEPLATKEHIVSFLAGQRHEHLHKRLDRSFTDLGRKISGMSHQRFGRVNWLALGHQGETLVMYDLCDRAHLLSTIQKTHEILTPRLIERFLQMDYRLIVAMRHPLDTLVSIAAKLCKPPSVVLADLEWFEKMATALRDYCAAVLDANRDVSLIHYERLITEPITAIRETAEAIGRECSSQRASDVWEQVGFRSLHAPGHLWQPGMDKWRKYMCRRHVEIAQELGLDTLAAELGYHDLEPTAVGDEPLSPPPPPELLPTVEMAIGDHTFSRIYGRPPTFLHPQVLYENDDSGIGWISNSRWYTQQYIHLMQSPLMRRYLQTLDRPVEAPARRHAA